MVSKTIAIAAGAVIGCTLVGCSKTDGEGRAASPPEATETPGGGEATASLAQSSMFAGTTSAGVRPGVNFAAKNVKDSEVDSVVAELTKRAKFMDRNGGAVPVDVKSQLVRQELTAEAGYILIVRPVQDLNQDEWHVLSVDPGYPEIETSAMGARVGYSPGKAFRVPLFTGSAPAIDHLVANKDGTVDVYFSEPIRIGSVSTGIEFVGDDAVWAGCASYLGQCIGPDTGIINGVVNYKFNSARAVKAAGRLTVTIPGAARGGGGRTASEAARAGFLGNGQAIQLTAADWKDSQAFRRLPVK